MRHIATAFTLLVGTRLVAPAQDEVPPLLADLAELNLHVVKAEIVEELRAVDIDGETVIKPRDTDVVVVVTLQGFVEEPWRVTFATDSFTAIYETSERAYDDGELEVDLRRSRGVTQGEDRWLLKPEGGNVKITLYLRDPGPITIKAAFTVPGDVETFDVRVPTVAEGEVDVQRDWLPDGVDEGRLLSRPAPALASSPAESCPTGKAHPHLPSGAIDQAALVTPLPSAFLTHAVKRHSPR